MSIEVCLKCSYSLHGLPEAHPCPECGFVTDLAQEQERVRRLYGQPLRLAMRLLNPWYPLPLAWWYTADSEDRKARRRRVALLVALILLVPMIPAVISAALVMEVEDVRTLNMNAVMASRAHPKPDPDEKRRRRMTFTFGGSQWYDYPPPIRSHFWDGDKYTFRRVESRRVRWFQRFSFLGPSAMCQSLGFSTSLLLAWALVQLATWWAPYNRVCTDLPGPGWVRVAYHSLGHVFLVCAVATAAIWVADALGRVAFSGLWSIAWWPAVLARRWAVATAPCLIIAVATLTLIRSDRARRALPNRVWPCVGAGLVILVWAGTYVLCSNLLAPALLHFCAL